MSWLDLPPDPNAPVISLTSAGKKDDDGFAKVLLTLVGAGLLGVATEYGLELWKPEDPSRLASVLGVGLVERVDTYDGFAECGHLDPDKHLLLLRDRNPYEGSPRTFVVNPGTFPEERLDPWARWQMDRMADHTVATGEGWSLHEPGYGSSRIDLTFSIASGKIVIDGSPVEITKGWKGALPGARRSAGNDPSRSLTYSRTKTNATEAVRQIAAAMERAGLRPWELMPTWSRA